VPLFIPQLCLLAIALLRSYTLYLVSTHLIIRCKAKKSVQVQVLQKQLQEEIDLHVALANAVAHHIEPLLISPSKIPDEVTFQCSDLSSVGTFHI